MTFRYISKILKLFKSVCVDEKIKIKKDVEDFSLYGEGGGRVELLDTRNV